MKAHCLYKIEAPRDYYLYVLQMKNYTDSIDMLAIRSDFSNAVIPLYSVDIEYKEDLGYPTTELLISIGHSFYTSVKTAIICCNLNLKGSSLRENMGEFLRENISVMCYNNISKIQNGYSISNNTKTQHSIFASIGRMISRREIATYVQDKIPT